MRIHILVVLVAAAVLSARAEMRQVSNDASLIPASLPGGALAPGSLFRIAGTRLGPDPPVTASGWPLELAGVRVRFRSSAGVWEAPLAEVGRYLIRGRIPTDAPVGPVQVTVVVDGRAGTAYTARIAPAALGFFSLNGRGYGRASEATWQPGDVVKLRGTGMELQQQSSRVTIRIGNRPAPIVSVREEAAGVQEITVRIPPGVQGCHVPVRGLIDGHEPTNTVTLMISAGREDCPAAWDLWRSAGPGARAGVVALVRAALRLDLADGSAEASTTEHGAAAFSRLSGKLSPLDHLVTLPPPGSCVTYAGTADLEGMSDVLIPFGWEDQTPLFPGDLVIEGAAAPAVVPGERGMHSWKQVGGAMPGSDERLPLRFEPGRYRVSSPGGDGVGPFSAAAGMPGLPLWANLVELGRINRGSDATLLWRVPAGEHHNYTIVGLQIDLPTLSGAAFVCSEQASKGQFTIPRHVLAVLPPARPDRDRSLGFLVMVNGATHDPPRIEAEGLNFGAAYGLNIVGRTAVFE